MSPATYDSGGNQTGWSIGANAATAAYDPFNQIKQVKGFGINAVHAYDADGERVLTRDLLTGTSSIALRDPGGKVLREVVYTPASATWSWKKDYVWRDGALLASVSPTEGIRHYHLDHLGTPRLVTNRSGERVARFDYWPFGAEIVAGSAQDPTERMRFTGHERDLGRPDSGGDDLDYMHARYFGPAIGRFMSTDLESGVRSLPQSWNKYAYVRGNPVGLIDPDGKRDPVAELMSQQERWAQANLSASDYAAHAALMRVGVPLAALAGATGGLGLGAALDAWAAIAGTAAINAPTIDKLGIAAVEALNPNPGGMANRVSIPGPVNSAFGKVEYLLGQVPGNSASAGKGGFFSGVLGFTRETLGKALESHLLSNLEKAAVDGNKVRVVAPMVGANGVQANVVSVWQILEANGQRVYRFVTAQPGPH